MSEIVLYAYWRSSSSYRVRLALAAKGLAYRLVPVNLLAKEQTRPEHLARNPMGQVPCLEVGGRLVVESVAILELLEELFPEPPLLPRDNGPFARARVRAMVEVVNAGVQPFQNLAVLQRVSPDAAVRADWARHFIGRGLAAFEAMMAENERAGVKGRFAYGSAISMADCLLVPQVFAARRFEVDLQPMPRVVAAADAVAAMEVYRAAAPEAQPDAVKDAT
jgi:maleylacetoacetate isomerase